jgi:hypothetical protein
LQLPNSATCNRGERILHGNHGSLDSDFDEETGAGRCFSLVAAGLQGHVGRATGQSVRQTGLAGRIDGHPFSMWTAEPLVVAFADDFALANQHAADHGVGFDITQPPLRQLQGLQHPLLIID